VDPHRDIEALNLELSLHDLGIVERRLERLEITVRSARPGEREAGERELRPLHRVREYLEQELPLRNQSFTGDELKQLANYGLLTLKPELQVINIDEADVAQTATVEADFRARYVGAKTGVAAICAGLEAELAELSPEEAVQFRQELGASEPAAGCLMRLAQEVLGLVTFYTVVGEECRAWPVPSGTVALQAAGRIHSDMERGFIRAEAIAYEVLLEMGSLAEARKHGLLRIEGKQYVLQDGDVLHILFHV
jgi:ribosome-binding ATPase YchF (GTP1/OBG family)